MAWFYVFLGLYWLAEPLDRRGYKWLSLLCMTPMALAGLAFLVLNILTFCESIAEAVALSAQNPFYFPLNIVIAVLRGMTGGFIRIDFVH